MLDDLAQSDTQSGTRRYIPVLDQQSMAEARAHGHPEAVVRKFMYANSIRVVDYLSLLGRGAVESGGRQLRWNPRDPDVVLATVRFASGDVGVYEGVWNGPGP